jgi:hypothetical protein
MIGKYNLPCKYMGINLNLISKYIRQKPALKEHSNWVINFFHILLMLIFQISSYVFFSHFFIRSGTIVVILYLCCTADAVQQKPSARRCTKVWAFRV